MRKRLSQSYNCILKEVGTVKVYVLIALCRWHIQLKARWQLKSSKRKSYASNIKFIVLVAHTTESKMAVEEKSLALVKQWPWEARGGFVTWNSPKDNVWCVGWQNGGMQSKDGKELTLLGDMVLSNKLVLYDLENQTIGWAKYNCSSSVKVRDDPSGQEYLIGYHDLASASNRNTGWTLTLLLLLAILGSFI
ncbi:hypothetical protein CsSME_00000063 [Camellia sinensis var. sinensis]